MKLVFLPGMDGTGRLFDEFLALYKGASLIIPLPQNGEQDFEFLAKLIGSQLPSEEFILLAESYSGGIVPYLIMSHSYLIKGVIFVATFLTPPNKWMLKIAQHIPIRKLAGFPPLFIAHRILFFGINAPRNTISTFIDVVKSVPESTIRKRLQAMYKMKLPSSTLDVPAIYIQATGDRLIPPKKWLELSAVFVNSTCHKIQGPHFILQANPYESVRIVSKAVEILTINSGP